MRVLGATLPPGDVDGYVSATLQEVLVAQLDGKKIVFLMANAGVEQVELTRPWEALEAAGADCVLVAPASGTVQAFNNDVEKGDTFDVDTTVADLDADTVDALVLPGGTTNPDQLRLDEDAVSLVRRLVGAGTPVAAICHGPWTLVEADVLRGKTLTSYPSVSTDVRNAGGTWVDDEAVTCLAEGWTLVTSRNPGDLDAFVEASIEAFSG